MHVKCIGCGLDWNVSNFQRIPSVGYICPHCESRIRAGETIRDIQQRPKGPAARRKEREE